MSSNDEKQAAHRERYAARHDRPRGRELEPGDSVPPPAIHGSFSTAAQASRGRFRPGAQLALAGKALLVAVLVCGFGVGAAAGVVRQVFAVSLYRNATASGT
jgi:hypothetical protein